MNEEEQKKVIESEALALFAQNEISTITHSIETMVKIFEMSNGVLRKFEDSLNEDGCPKETAFAATDIHRAMVEIWKMCAKSIARVRTGKANYKTIRDSVLSGELS